ncbi:MAG: DegT/DnrJ/EryC1/StrS aminotransferase family protein [Magnetovibrio sp.]|nr:DegT/DnrJ/EryC1/StrS aminotransferase family protein [Magnetovibrio sp.]
MTPYKFQLETRLMNLFQFEGSVLAGRARSLICALLEEVAVGKPVLIPANICTSVAISIIEAGAIPVAVPVSPETGLPTLETLREVLDQSQPGVWMIPHLYGFIQNYGVLVEEYRSKGWFILENDTNAIRPKYNVGFQPDASVLSFGYAKVIHAGGGGALLSDDLSLVKEIAQKVYHYPRHSVINQTMEENVMIARRALRTGGDSPISNMSDLNQIFEVERQLVRFNWSDVWARNLEVALDGYDDEVAHRNMLKDLWDSALHAFESNLVPVNLPQPIPWRLIRTVKDKRQVLLQELRRNGIDAGTNYGSLSKELPQNLIPTSAKDVWGGCVLNLWLDRNYSIDKIQKSSEIISKVFS